MKGIPFRAGAPFDARHDARRYAAWLLGLILAGILAYHLAGEVRHAVTVFGTARAPLSDAYDPWLRGALTYLFFGEPHGSLYRPTIGIFFGSILSVAGRIDAIPVFFAAVLCLFLACAVAKADAGLKPALVAWLAYALLEFDKALKPLNFGNLMPDPPAFLFTVMGAWCVLCAMRTRPVEGRWLAAGFLALGLAATIRGPMMLAGPAMLVFIATLARSRSELRAIVAAGLLFVLPLLIDVAQQRAYGVVNNGLATMFCFYTDPSFSWTTPCHNTYLASHPAPATIVANYLRMLAGDGYAVVVGNLNARLYEEGLRLHAMGFRIAALGLVAYLAAAAAAHALPALQGRSAIGRIGVVLRARQSFLLRLAILAAVVFYAFGFRFETFTAYVSAGVAAVCLVFRLPRAFLCLGAYWLAAVFLAMMTQAHQNRLGLTFSFLLYLALFLAISEQRRVAGPAAMPAARRTEVAPVYALVAFLYLAVFLFPSHLARVYASEVAQTDKALLVSRDDAKDQCVYFNGRRDMFYRPCGTVKSVR